jgi:hypothetical protein
MCIYVQLPLDPIKPNLESMEPRINAPRRCFIVGMECLGKTRRLDCISCVRREVRFTFIYVSFRDKACFYGDNETKVESGVSLSRRLVQKLSPSPSFHRGACNYRTCVDNSLCKHQLLAVT